MLWSIGYLSTRQEDGIADKKRSREAFNLGYPREDFEAIYLPIYEYSILMPISQRYYMLPTYIASKSIKYVYRYQHNPHTHKSTLTCCTILRFSSFC
jgi:hypothetical protein